MKKATTSTTRTGLSMRWVPVTDGDGRVRMEMRWTAPPAIRPRSVA